MKKKDMLLILIFILLVLLTILVISIATIKNKIKQNDEIPIEQREESGVQYDRTQLDNVKININGLDNNIKKHISNLDEFYLTFKEYIYINGLVDAKNAIVEDYETTEQKLQIEFKLDDINNTSIEVIIDLITDEIEILEYNT